MSEDMISFTNKLHNNYNEREPKDFVNIYVYFLHNYEGGKTGNNVSRFTVVSIQIVL